jgi:hypothetical protein
VPGCRHDPKFGCHSRSYQSLLGRPQSPQLVRLVPFDCRSVALSPSDCESGQTKRPVPWTLVDSVANPAAEVTTTYRVALAYTQMRCNTAFRPRRKILEFLHPTFWALWNQLVARAREEPAAIEIEALVDDLRTQIEYYEGHGVGMRGGIAPMYAGKVGAGQRLSEEIAEFAEMPVEEFRALPEAERSEIIHRHTEASLRQLDRLDYEVAAFAGLSAEELRALPQSERKCHLRTLHRGISVAASAVFGGRYLLSRYR